MFRSGVKDHLTALAARSAVMSQIKEHGSLEISELVVLVEAAVPGLGESEIKAAAISLANRGLLEMGPGAQFRLGSVVDQP